MPRKKQEKSEGPKVEVLDERDRIPSILQKMKSEYPCADGWAMWMTFYWYLAVGPGEVIVVQCKFKKAFFFYIGVDFDRPFRPLQEEMDELKWRATLFFRIRYGDNFPRSKRHLDPPDPRTRPHTISVQNCIGYTLEFQRFVKNLIWKYDRPVEEQMRWRDVLWLPDKDMSTGSALPWGEDRDGENAEVGSLAEEMAEVVLDEDVLN